MPKTWKLDERVVGVAIVPKLPDTPRLRGSRGNLPAHLPQGNEAQCAICDLIFSSDTACEMHKPYRRPTTKSCKDPSQLGMIPVHRGDRTVWVRSSGGI